MIRRAAASAAAAVALATGCADGDLPPSPPVPESSSLTAAVPDAGDAAVVAILFDDHAACTGVLVGPRIVLTAAHCLISHVARPRVLFGSSVATAVAVLEVTQIYLHADFSPLSTAHDIAALRLDSDVPGGLAAVALPLPSSLADAEGGPVRLVGFGHESELPEAGAPHVKRQGTARIATVGAATITLTPSPSQACVGDSGGPVFSGLGVGGHERLIGLVIGGITSCLETAHALRIDAYTKSFVEPLVTGVGLPAGPTATAASSGCTAGGPQAPASPAALLAGMLATVLICGTSRKRPTSGKSRGGRRQRVEPRMDALLTYSPPGHTATASTFAAMSGIRTKLDAGSSWTPARGQCHSPSVVRYPAQTNGRG